MENVEEKVEETTGEEAKTGRPAKIATFFVFLSLAGYLHRFC